MLDIELEEKLIEKLGGKFKLTTLIQKRMVELHRPGAKSLVKIEGDRKDLKRIAIEEILQERIELALREEVGYSLEEEKLLLEKEKSPADEEEKGSSEIYGSDIKKIKEQRIKELAQILNDKK
jgi:DNA-directed RNA polymerase subunit omega